jgi:hypothetical protein
MRLAALSKRAVILAEVLSASKDQRKLVLGVCKMALKAVPSLTNPSSANVRDARYEPKN